jgi:hypothetical protein
MTSVVFETHGLIDVRAFTTLGLSAKPNSTSPIGYFGTGLNYSIATLLRIGATVVVYIGRDRYDFFVEKDSFRGAEYQKIRMRRKKWSLTRSSIVDLPFSLSYGRNWKPWMAFRELESNTRDEGGETYTIGGAAEAALGETTAENKTYIVVTSPLFLDAYEKRDDVFLPGATRDGQGVVATEDGPKDRLYWRGLRVFDPAKPTTFTYNVLGDLAANLTEDRTLPEYYAKAAVANWLLKSDDEAKIEAVLTCDEDAWEYEMNFPSWVSPGETFRRVAARVSRRMFPGASSYWGGYAPPREKRSTTNPWVAYPLPWVAFDDRIEDDNGVTIFERPSDFDADLFELLGEALVKRLSRAKLPEAGRDLIEVVGDDEGVLA